MPENTDNPLLQQLQDVHLPTEVGWWPLAPGWWILMLLVAASGAWLLRKWILRYRLNLYRKSAINELNALHLQWQQTAEVKLYLQSANAVLRRAMLHLEGGSKLSSLTGRQWAAALNRYCKKRLSDETIEALTVGCYQHQPRANIDAVNRQLCDWLKAHSRQALSVPTTESPARMQEPNHA